MKKRQAILTLVLLALGLGIATQFWQRSPDPVYQGRRTSVWVRELNASDPDNNTQEKAREVIRELGPEAVTVLAQNVRLTGRGKYPDVRQTFGKITSVLPRGMHRSVRRALGFTGGYFAGSGAAIALEEMQADAKEAVPALLDGLNDADANIRSCSACALIRIAPDDPTVVAILSRKLFEDPESWILDNVSNGFRHLSATNQVIIPLLEKTVSISTNSRAKLNAALALGRHDPADQRGLTTLINFLQDADPFVCIEAASGLWRLQHPTADLPAGPERPMIKIHRDFPALGEVYPKLKTKLPQLTQNLNHSQRWTRVWSATAIWEITHQTELVEPTLMAAAQNREEWWCAARTLVAIGGETSRLVTLISDQVANGDWNFSCSEPAIETLGWMGTDAREVTPALKMALTNRLATIRLSAAHALWKIDPQPAELLPFLKSWLETGGVYTKIRVAEILGDLGGAAGEMMPALVPLLNDKSMNVRRAVEAALQRINPSAQDQKKKS